MIHGAFGTVSPIGCGAFAEESWKIPAAKRSTTELSIIGSFRVAERS